jgi:hypothetical protein
MLLGHVGLGYAQTNNNASRHPPTTGGILGAGGFLPGFKNPLSPFGIGGPALFQPPDLTSKVLASVAAQERMRNQLGRTRASTFFGGDLATTLPMTQRSLFGRYGAGGR